MSHDPTRHHRRSIRLRDYDYTQAGAYFVTVCTQSRQPVLGEVTGGQMILNGPGQMVEAIWRELPRHYTGVDVDAFVVMPNHVHGIIILVGAVPGIDVGAGPRARPNESGQPQGVHDSGQPQGVHDSGQPQGVHDSGQPQGVAPTRAMSLPDVVHRFKSLTTTRYRLGGLRDGWQPFPGRLWQRNYYEHIIRDEKELNLIRQYMADNPARWAEDPENPAIGA